MVSPRVRLAGNGSSMSAGSARRGRASAPIAGGWTWMRTDVVPVGSFSVFP